MSFKKIIGWLHLWPGLASGIVVLILGITGCILVFEDEIKGIYSPWLFAEKPGGRPLLPPSGLYQSAVRALPGKKIGSVWYHGTERTAAISANSDSTVYIDPYSGKIAALVSGEDFFHFIEEGHTRLWLPARIGVPVVGWSTFVFFTLLFTGIILWWPKKWNRRGIDQSFKIRWKAKFKRINYDLHNVLGFYSLLVAILFAITGLIMSFPWFSKTVYFIAGQQGAPVYHKALSDTTSNTRTVSLMQVDKAWQKGIHQIAEYNVNDIIISFPEKASDAIYVCTDMVNGSWRDVYLDQHTLKELPASQLKLKDENAAGWIRRNNYSLHVGLMAGLPVKIIYFLGSLICASLPVTGFYVWWGKKKKPARKLKHKAVLIPS